MPTEIDSQPIVKGFIPDDDNVFVPDAAPAEKQGPNLVQRFADSVAGIIKEHPAISTFFNRLMQTPEHKFSQEDVNLINSDKRNLIPKAQVGETQERKGPGLMEIPGVSKATDYLSQKVAGSEGNFRLGAGAVVKAIGDTLATGFDPRNVGVQEAIHSPEPTPKELPSMRQSREIPYRMDTGPVKTPSDANIFKKAEAENPNILQNINERQKNLAQNRPEGTSFNYKTGQVEPVLPESRINDPVLETPVEPVKSPSEVVNESRQVLTAPEEKKFVSPFEKPVEETLIEPSAPIETSSSEVPKSFTPDEELSNLSSKMRSEDLGSLTDRMREETPKSFVADEEVKAPELVGVGASSQPKQSVFKRLLSEEEGGVKIKNPAAEPNTGPHAAALDKLFNSMGQLMENRVSQDIINKSERAKRFAAFSNVKEEGVEGAAKSLSSLKGEFDKVDNAKLQMSPEETDSLFTAIKNSNITLGEKARGYTALFKILNGGATPQRNELQILNDVFGNNFANKIMEMHGGLGAVGVKLSKTANTMKAMKSSIDFSAPLRQGIGLIHRPEYREAFSHMFKYFAKPEYFEQAMKDIESHPMYLPAREAGLFLAKPNGLTNGEEAFMNNYVHNIPRITGLPAGIEASERAYTGFLNDLRFNTFKNLIKNAEAAGHNLAENPKIAEDLAKYINVSTGRGSLGRLEKVATDLNTIFWSPRLLSSRLTVLNPKYYMSLDPFARREAIKSLFAIASAGLTMITLGKMAGGKTSLNPESADFGKVRFPSGNVLDPWAGHQQVVTAAARLISGMSNGKPQSRTTTLENFGANKLSPMAALAYELASAKHLDFKKSAPGNMSSLGIPQQGGFTNRYGQQKYLSTEIKNNFIPMFVDDATKLFQTDAGFAEQVGLDTASLFGSGVQNYPESGKKKLTMRKPKMQKLH